MKRIVLAAAVTVALSARANPSDVYGFGARGPAMANAQTAIARDSSAGYYNPAGLALGTGLQLDAGYRYAAPKFEIDGKDADVQSLRGLTAGLVIPSTAIPNHRLALGLSLAVPQGRLFHFRSTAVDVPRVILYDNRPQRLFLAMNLAIEVLPGLYAGAGMATLSRSQGNVNLEGNVALSDPSLSALQSSLDVGLFGVRYPQAGLLWVPNDKVSVGLSYRHEFRLEIEQTFRIEGSLGDPGKLPLVKQGYFEAQTRIRDLFQPAQLTAGGAMHVTPALLVSADVTWARWSAFPASAPLAISIDLGPALNPFVDVPPPKDPGPPHFHDLVVPRLGAEWRVRDGAFAVDLRAGYSFEASPVPAQVAATNYADGDKHTFSIGAGFDVRGLQPLISGGVTLDLYAAGTIVPQRIDAKDTGAELRSSGTVLQTGAMTRLRF